MCLQNEATIKSVEDDKSLNECRMGCIIAYFSGVLGRLLRLFESHECTLSTSPFLTASNSSCKDLLRVTKRTVGCRLLCRSGMRHGLRGILSAKDVTQQAPHLVISEDWAAVMPLTAEFNQPSER